MECKERKVENKKKKLEKKNLVLSECQPSSAVGTFPDWKPQYTQRLAEDLRSFNQLISMSLNYYQLKALPALLLEIWSYLAL